MQIVGFPMRWLNYGETECNIYIDVGKRRFSSSFPVYSMDICACRNVCLLKVSALSREYDNSKMLFLALLTSISNDISRKVRLNQYQLSRFT